MVTYRYITPRSSILVEKLTVLQLLKKFKTFNESGKFTAVVT
jgi:hypothetical protein